MHPRHVAQDDHCRMLRAKSARLISDGGAVPVEVGRDREGEGVRVLGRRAQASDDRYAVAGERGDLVVFPERSRQPDHRQHVLRDHLFRARVGGAGVVLGVAPDVLHLAAIDPALGIDELHVGTHRVALDRRVDWTGDVEEAADRDRASADARLRLRAGPCAARGCLGVATSAAGHIGGRARHLALGSEAAHPALCESEHRHHAEHRGDYHGTREQCDRYSFPEAASYHGILRNRDSNSGRPESGAIAP